MPADTSLRDRRSRLLAQPGLMGEEFCRSYAAEADAWLSELADRAAGENKRHLALLAVGGYGRSSLCPYSDLDVVLVHSGFRDVKDVADGIWYPVWDEGVHLDHSVRRPAEVLSAAAEDLRVALGLLDARVVWGERKLAEPLIEKAKAAWRDKLGTQYLPVIEVQMAERRATAGDVAFLLEPDLKESHGGLRDVSVLRALSAYAPLLADYADLASLDDATALLTSIRVELHRMAKRGARAAAAPGPGPGGRRARVPRRRRVDARRLHRGPPDRVGGRRRMAPPQAVGPHAAAQALLPPAPRRTPKTSTTSRSDLAPDLIELQRRGRAHFVGPGVRRPVAPPASGGHRRRASIARSRGLAAPARRPHAAAERPLDPTPRGTRSSRCSPSAGRPSTRSSRSISTASSSGSSPSGPPSATSRSATPTTASPSTGTCSRLPRWPPS